MSALFNFESFMRSLILLICTATYFKRRFPSLVQKKHGLFSVIYKCCVVGERLSPFVAMFCFVYALQKFYGVFF
ncbi:hypothetical protein PAEPH01_1049 [Pancytospora epiphaga]|nr:hypothetical protein PAEPH01_1049 [Pancytospora epiphaga]